MQVGPFAAKEILHLNPSLGAVRAKGIENITKAVIAAEAAMFQRWQELSGESDHAEERGQLREASDKLLKLKIEKLGWPNPSV